MSQALHTKSTGHCGHYTEAKGIRRTETNAVTERSADLSGRLWLGRRAT
jgi:hypothetical protein